MEIYTGKIISSGIAVGNLYFYEKKKQQIKCCKILNPAEEQKRFVQAKQSALKQLEELYQKAAEEVGTANADIFQVHAMMLEDEDYNDSIRNKIVTQQVNAEYAVAVTGDHFSEMFSKMEDEYFRARAVDIKDISERLISVLQNQNQTGSLPPTPSILMAGDLVPSETVQMEKRHLLGFVTQSGSATSHTAILARTMGIPAITGIEVRKEWERRQVILDGERGQLILDPDPAVLKNAELRLEEKKTQRQILLEYKGKDTVTASGRKIQLFANVGSMTDLPSVLENDAEGIGLFRSEFLYLKQDHFPSEEEQFQVYRTAAEHMAGKKMIIRTLDIGADKQADYFGLKKEENPALGYRAVRICLDRPELFKTQLRAILRASAYGKIAVMYPMIISKSEVRRIREWVEEVKRELRAQGIDYDKELEQGIMIETPAAALISAELADEVDFFSIGTNDLTQYTLAIDRQNESLERFLDPYHPAVLKLIEMTVKNGHARGCWVGICGELGADEKLTEWLVKIGMDEFSVAPSRVLSLRKKISEIEDGNETRTNTHGKENE